MVERVSNGFKVETFTRESILENNLRQEYFSALLKAIWSTCQDDGGDEATLANASLYFYVLATGRNFKFQSLEGGQVIAEEFRTRNDKTRIFYEARNEPGSEDLILSHLKKFVYLQYRTGARECRVVLPSEIISNLDDVRGIFEDKWEMKEPNKVWRVYGNRNDFAQNNIELPSGFKEVALSPQNRDEVLQLFEENYRRSSKTPRHSFDPNRLWSDLYKGLRETEGEMRLATAAGEVGSVDINFHTKNIPQQIKVKLAHAFNLGYREDTISLSKSIGRIAIIGDLVKAAWVMDSNVPRYVSNSVVQRAFNPGPLRAKADLVVADMINRASLRLALDLNARQPHSKKSKLWIDAERIKKP